MTELPEKFEGETKLSVEEAETALIGAGYCRLSEINRKVIAGKAEALAFAQEAAEQGEPKKGRERALPGEG
ncbi:MAG: hypothetical protein LBT95_07310 [Treponema sp.]|jgi:hypothetical protein|nr:hypothetical protein [Treponema sp.]